MSLYHKLNEILDKSDNETIYDLYDCGYKFNLNHFRNTTSHLTLLGNVNSIIKIACNGSRLLAINDRGELYAWGYNYHGQLGLGD